MRARRASLLGAAAVPAAALTYAVAAAVWQAHRCGLHPVSRAVAHTIRTLDAAWERRAEHF
jgi:hypothetical protein